MANSGQQITKRLDIFLSHMSYTRFCFISAKICSFLAAHCMLYMARGLYLFPVCAIPRVCHLEMQNGVLCGLRFRCKYALCLVFTAFDFLRIYTYMKIFIFFFRAFSSAFLYSFSGISISNASRISFKSGSSTSMKR